MKSNSHQQGKLAEEKAFTYLKEQGLKPLARNYRSPQGEIDLIMQDREITVFIEVRARTDNHTMNILETINPQKCRHIIQTCKHYLQKHKRTYKDICRFDVFLIMGPLETAKIEWIKNAFEA